MENNVAHSGGGHSRGTLGGGIQGVPQGVANFL